MLSHAFGPSRPLPCSATSALTDFRTPPLISSLVTGPFWTLTTLAFTLYVFSSLSTSISAYIANPDVPPVQDVGKLSLAAALCYTYGIGFPTLLWGVVRWFGGADIAWSIVEAVSIYGCESARSLDRTRIT